MSLLDAGTALLRRLDAEQAHELAIAGLKYLPLPVIRDDPVLKTEVAGLSLSNPVGLAAGLDKNAVAIRGLAGLGFGFVECGSVTPRPQAGNPRPRLFRLEQDRAIINRMGFNNDGLDAFAARLAQRPPGVVVGANLGANKDADDRIADYETGLRRLGGLADYLTVNVSSPNTPGLRTLQSGDALDELLKKVNDARWAEPVFLKVAPDLDEAGIETIVKAVETHALSGLIVSNTTLERPESLQSRHKGEAGGLSGLPLKTRSTEVLRQFRRSVSARAARKYIDRKWMLPENAVYYEYDSTLHLVDDAGRPDEPCHISMDIGDQGAVDHVRGLRVGNPSQVHEKFGAHPIASKRIAPQLVALDLESGDGGTFIDLNQQYIAVPAKRQVFEQARLVQGANRLLSRPVVQFIARCHGQVGQNRPQFQATISNGLDIFDHEAFVGRCSSGQKACNNCPQDP